MIYAFIGHGNMVRAIVSGMVRAGIDGSTIHIVNPRSRERLEAFCSETGTTAATEEILGRADCVVLGFKPQSMLEAAPYYKAHMKSDTLTVSIMAGIGIEKLKDSFDTQRVIRVMPNLALSVGCGASGYAVSASCSAEDEKAVQAMFSASGVCARVSEAQIDDVAALSGSGAAYICLLLESMRDAAVSEGVMESLASEFALQTLRGAAALLADGKTKPEDLRARITSKKGTTEAALNAMRDGGLPEAVAQGYRANKRRSAELSRVD